jgi:hypothetical protein
MLSVVVVAVVANAPGAASMEAKKSSSWKARFPINEA